MVEKPLKPLFEIFMPLRKNSATHTMHVAHATNKQTPNDTVEAARKCDNVNGQKNPLLNATLKEHSANKKILKICI